VKVSDDTADTYHCAAPHTMTDDPIGNHRQVIEVFVARQSEGQVNDVEDDAQNSTNDQQYADDWRVPVAVIFQL